ncbi:MAG: SMI1/KNR4 family protein [Planctomycetota bacterium]
MTSMQGCHWLDILTRPQPFEVQWPGERPWKARHMLEAPATLAAAKRAEVEVGLPLPKEVGLLWDKTDGGIFYKNESGPAWGWRLSPTASFLEFQHKWRRKFFDDWRSGHLVILELADPSMALALDTTRGGVYVLEDDRGQMKPRRVAATVSEALERLVEAQGGLWWAWGA